MRIRKGVFTGNCPPGVDLGDLISPQRTGKGTRFYLRSEVQFKQCFDKVCVFEVLGQHDALQGIFADLRDARVGVGSRKQGWKELFVVVEHSTCQETHNKSFRLDQVQASIRAGVPRVWPALLRDELVLFHRQAGAPERGCGFGGTWSGDLQQEQLPEPPRQKSGILIGEPQGCAKLIVVFAPTRWELEVHKEAQDEVEQLRRVLHRRVVVVGKALEEDGQEFEALRHGEARYALLDVEDVEVAYQRRLRVRFVLLQQCAHGQRDVSAEAVSVSGHRRVWGGRHAYCDLMRVLMCWHTEMTLFLTAACSEPSFKSSGARYVFSRSSSFLSEPASAMRISTLPTSASSLAAAACTSAMSGRASRAWMRSLEAVRVHGQR
jgi:hypothetical protein